MGESYITRKGGGGGVKINEPLFGELISSTTHQEGRFVSVHNDYISSDNSNFVSHSFSNLHCGIVPIPNNKIFFLIPNNPGSAGDSGNFKYRIGTRNASNNTISFDTALLESNKPGEGGSRVLSRTHLIPLEGNQLIYTYIHNTTVKAFIINISDTTATFGTTFTVATGVRTEGNAIYGALKINNNKVLISYNTSAGQSQTRFININNNVLSASNPVIIQSTSSTNNMFTRISLDFLEPVNGNIRVLFSGVIESPGAFWALVLQLNLSNDSITTITNKQFFIESGTSRAICYKKGSTNYIARFVRRSSNNSIDLYRFTVTDNSISDENYISTLNPGTNGSTSDFNLHTFEDALGYYVYYNLIDVNQTSGSNFRVVFKFRFQTEAPQNLQQQNQTNAIDSGILFTFKLDNNGLLITSHTNMGQSLSRFVNGAALVENFQGTFNNRRVALTTSAAVVGQKIKVFIK
jgi:hypothetical protein